MSNTCHQWITFGASTPVFNDNIRDDNGMTTLCNSSETLSWRPPSSLGTFLSSCLLFCIYRETFLLPCNVAVNSKSVALCQTLSSKCVVTRFPDNHVSIPLKASLPFTSHNYHLHPYPTFNVSWPQQLCHCNDCSALNIRKQS